jgi:hypothetical protein
MKVALRKVSFLREELVYPTYSIHLPSRIHRYLYRYRYRYRYLIVRRIHRMTRPADHFAQYV